MSNMPEDIVQALRDGDELTDPKLQSLRVFTRQLIETRGHVGDDAVNAFLSAGYSKRQALEVLVGLSTKLLSNFTNALAHTELDDPVKPHAWIHPEDR